MLSWPWTGDLAVMWPLATGARGAVIARVCVYGGGHSVPASPQLHLSLLSFQAAASGPPCHLGSSWHAVPAPTWRAATAQRGHSHLPVPRILFFFYSNKCISKHANNVKAQREISRGHRQIKDTTHAVANVLLLFKFSVRCHVCSFWSASLLLDAWMSSTLGQATWQLWLHPLAFATKLAVTICFSIWPFHWWNSILSEGNVIKMNRTLKIWELFDMGQTTYEESAFQWFLIHICMQWCMF